MSLYNLFKRRGNSSTLRLNDLPKVSKVDISQVAMLVLEPRFSELCIILPALHEHTGPLMGTCSISSLPLHYCENLWEPQQKALSIFPIPPL